MKALAALLLVLLLAYGAWCCTDRAERAALRRLALLHAIPLLAILLVVLTCAALAINFSLQIL